jgi:AmmeMemoRadiSam system protein B
VEALKELNTKKTIVVIASTDMLHDPDYELVTKTDRQTLEKLVHLKLTEITNEWTYSHQTFCGLLPVMAAAQFAQSQGSKEGILLKYRNTGDDFPESRGQWVVGYGSVIFTVP